jgi:membrane protease YdiL (CAAX protease family)
MRIRRDLVMRLFPLTATVAGVWVMRRPPWLGISQGKLRTQLAFGGGAAIAFFFSAALLQRWLTGDKEPFRLAANGREALLQSGYFVLNATVEEAFFRGLLQGSVGARLGAPAGLLAGTVPYVLYHRLGGWGWPQVAATSLAAVPLALAYRMLPGRPSLLGISLAHIGATAGFLGPGTWVLRRLGLHATEAVPAEYPTAL